MFGLFSGFLCVFVRVFCFVDFVLVGGLVGCWEFLVSVCFIGGFGVSRARLVIQLSLGGVYVERFAIVDRVIVGGFFSLVCGFVRGSRVMCWGSI